jgi:hypothetical protein
LDHHVSRPSAIELIARAELKGIRAALRENAFVVSSFNPAGVPGSKIDIGEDTSWRRWYVIDTVLHAQEENTTFGAGVLAAGAVDQRIGATAGGEAIGPEALNPTEAPEGRVDIGESGCNGGWMGRIRDGAVLAAQNENSGFGSTENVVWAVEAGIGGASGDVAGIEESIDVIEGPVARKDVLKDGGGRRGG